jgi:hypothetical protein
VRRQVAVAAATGFRSIQAGVRLMLQQLAALPPRAGARTAQLGWEQAWEREPHMGMSGGGIQGGVDVLHDLRACLGVPHARLHAAS